MIYKGDSAYIQVGSSGGATLNEQMQLVGTVPGGSFSPDGKNFRYGVLIQAKAMAASVLKEANIPYDVGKIHKLVKDIASKEAFRDLTDQEVAENLCSLQNVQAARQKLGEKVFGVPKSEQQEYIQQMKKLSLQMFPGENSSDKYQQMESYVNLLHYGSGRAQEAHLDRMEDSPEEINLTQRIEANHEVDFDLNV